MNESEKGGKEKMKRRFGDFFRASQVCALVSNAANPRSENSADRLRGPELLRLDGKQTTVIFLPS